MVTLDGPSQCMNCHADFDEETQPASMLGSTTGQAARDPLSWAALTVAARDSIGAIRSPTAADLGPHCQFPRE